MAPGSLSTQPQELVLFKDVAVDFTHEEWSLLEPGQKELYKTVMLENAWNLLCVGLPVTKQDVICYFEQKEAPWILQEDLRTCFPGSQDSEGMAPGSLSTQCQELVLFKDVEEWSLLELNQELYKTVMLENACNLLCVGLPVTKQDVICYFDEKEAPWMLQEDLRICCPEEEIRLEMKETTGTLNLFVEENEKQGVLNDSPCDFTGSEFYAPHEKIPVRKKSHECKLRGKSFLWMGSLPAHQRVHPGLKPFECIPCGKAFICQSRLATHERNHTGEKLFECNDCGKAFTRERSLTAHQRIHPGEKLYKCNYCGKAFKWKNSLTRHQRIHTGEKPYECNQCGKALEWKPSLTTHERIHSEEKLYEFNYCGKAFNWKISLTRHQRIHTGQKL